MFNGTCNNKDLSYLPIEKRYYPVTWSSVWGGLGAYDIFKTIDELSPGDEIDYMTWQKLIYAGKLLAKHYDWFKYLDPANKEFCKKNVQWNDVTEEYDIDDFNPKL